MHKNDIPRTLRQGLITAALHATIATLLVNQAAPAATYTWTPTAAGTYNWNDASSQWTAGFPNTIGDAANLNINLADAQTINLNTGITLGTLNLGDTGSTFYATTLADGGGSLTFDASGSSNAQLNKTTAANNVNDAVSATILLNDNLDLANNSTTTGGTLTLTGGITAGTAGTKTIANRGTGTQGITLSGVIGKGSGDVALMQDSSSSTLTLNGSAVNTFTGGVNIKRGTVQLDFSNLASAANLLDNSNALTLGGGILTIKGNASGSTTQSFSSLTINGGGGVLLNPNGGSDTTFALGSIATGNTIGQSLLVGKTAGAGSGNAIITTSDAKDAQGLYYGGRVVYTSDGGSTVDWATTASTSSPYTFGTYGTDSGSYVALDTTAGTDTSNSRITSGTTTLGGNRITNSLKIEGGGQTLALGTNVLTLTSGGLLSAGPSLSTISGTANPGLKGSASGELLIHQYNTTGLTLSAIIGNNGGATVLTKAGTGMLKLTAPNTFTGGIVINSGKLQFVTDNTTTAQNLGAYPGSVTAANIAINNGGTLDSAQTANVIMSVNRGITLGSGIQKITRSGTAGWWQISGVIAGSDSSSGAVFESGNNGIRLYAANTYRGDTTVPTGNGIVLYNNLALQFSSLDMTVFTSGTPVTFSTGVTPIFGGLKGSDANKTLDMRNVNWSIGNNDQSTTFLGKLSSTTGAAALTKIGAGTLALSGANTFTGPISVNAGTLTLNAANSSVGTTTVNAGTLALGASGTINSVTNIAIKAAATFDVSAKTSYAMPSTQTFTIDVDPTGVGSAGQIHATGLDISAAKVALSLPVLPVKLDDAVYVLATYTPPLTGTAFASLTGLPEDGSYKIDYAYNGGTQIALVVSGAYDTWAASLGGHKAFNIDADGNGILNGLQWILGGTTAEPNPSAILPTLTGGAAGFTLIFTRNPDSITATTLMVDWGTDLDAFAHTLTIGTVDVPANGDNPTIDIDAPTTGKVTVVIPAANAPGGRLFARLRATMP